MCLDILDKIKFQIVDNLNLLGIDTNNDDFKRFWVSCMSLLTKLYCSPENLSQYKDYARQPDIRAKLEKYLSNQAIHFLIQEYFIDNLVNKQFNRFSNCSEFRICKEYVTKKLSKKMADDEFFIKKENDTFCNNNEMFNQLNYFLRHQINLYQDEQANLLKNKGRYEDINTKLYYECLDFQEFLYNRLKKIKIPSSYKLSFTSNGVQFRNGNVAAPVQIHLMKHKDNHKPDKKRHIEILQKVKAEINKYHTVQALRLQVCLGDQKNSHDQFLAFDTLFRQDQTQDNLKAYFDSSTWRFLKNIGHILTFGLVSRFMTKGTWRFWKTTEELFIERMTIQSQKDLDFQRKIDLENTERKMHVEDETTSASPSISISS